MSDFRSKKNKETLDWKSDYPLFCEQRNNLKKNVFDPDTIYFPQKLKETE